MDFNILLHKELYNKKSKEQLREKLELEDFNRTTCSFYKYVLLDNLHELRDKLYIEWNSLGVLVRIYLSEEGINAQVSVPEDNVDSFKSSVMSYSVFENINFKTAIQEGASFYKLNIKIKDENKSLIVTWRVKESKSRYYVIDLLVADISLVITKRAEFNSMLNKVNNHMFGEMM